MCLAVPALIESLEAKNMAVADVMGIKRNIALDLVPAAKVGDYVLLHAGYAIELIDERMADETIALLKELA